MKKILPGFLILLLLSTIHFTLLPPPVSAQDFNFNRAYNDYLFNYGQYRQSYSEYVSAKEAYLSYQTLTSKTQALEKTLKMLKDEDEVIKTYLTALRMKLAETTGISNYEQNVLYLKLDSEVSWYAQHKESLSSAATLEDLVTSSEKVADRYKNTEVLIYQTLGTILAGKETNFRNQLADKIQELKAKIGEIRQRGDKDTALAERWLLEAENRLTRSQEKQFTAQQILTKIKSSDTDKNQSYNKAQFAIEESHQYLKEANSYLKEVLREVKSAD